MTGKWQPHPFSCACEGTGLVKTVPRLQIRAGEGVTISDDLGTYIKIEIGEHVERERVVRDHDEEGFFHRLRRMFVQEVEARTTTVHEIADITVWTRCLGGDDVVGS